MARPPGCPAGAQCIQQQPANGHRLDRIEAALEVLVRSQSHLLEAQSAVERDHRTGHRQDLEPGGGTASEFPSPRAGVRVLARLL
jgi:hypothetical protein